MIVNESEIYPYSVSDLSDRDCLVLAPHPDDESIGCGGSIVRHVNRGSGVKVLFLTSGENGDFQNAFGEDYIARRRRSAIDALSVLGVKEYEFLGFRDRRLYEKREDALNSVLEVVESFSPRLLYVPSPFEAHPDHRTASWIGWELYSRTGIETAFYEVLMPLYPNILVDITGEYKTKEAAIRRYDTELYYNDYIDYVEGLNRLRTVTLGTGVRYAEAFSLFNKEYRGGLSCRLIEGMIKSPPAGLR